MAVMTLSDVARTAYPYLVERKAKAGKKKGKSKIKGGAIAGIIIAVVVVIIIALIILFLLRRQKKKKALTGNKNTTALGPV